MDNLEELRCHALNISDKEYGDCVACSLSEEKTCFITSRNYICVYDLMHLNNAAVNSKIEGNKLEYIHYLSSYDGLFAATKFELCIFKCSNLDMYVSHVLSKEIAALAWNPEETALVVIFSDNTMSLFHYCKSQFEEKYTIDLHVDVPSTVYVGWGSANTQFRGLKSGSGKPEKERAVPRVNAANAPPQISWRGNGTQFVVNLYKDQLRFIKVFDNKLQPLSISDGYDDLQDAVSFMQTGQCIATYFVKGTVNTITIFEKNCRVKSSFEVPENKGNIEKIRYHPHMNMLAVYSLDTSSYGHINIYLHSNGKWSLKQQLCFPPGRKVCDFEWSTSHQPLFTLCKLVVGTSQNIEYHTFRFIINRCPGTTLVPVVDGRNIDLYDFGRKTMPHPMKYCSLSHVRPINKILFHPQKLICVALDCMFQVVVIDVHNWTVLFSSDPLPLTNLSIFHSVLWNNKNEVQINIECNGDEIVTVKECCNWILKLETCKGQAEILLPYNDTDSLTSYKECDLSQASVIYLTKKVLNINNSDIEMDFALTGYGTLSLNGTVLFNGITSAFIYDDYLLLTTASCRLHCIRLMENYDILMNRALDLNKTFTRQIEQGARIVINNNNCAPQIVLFLPRGNLETVSCRLITVDVIEKMLCANDWKTALDIMRVERMNSNVLVDLNPERFSDHVKDFLLAVEYSNTLISVVNEFSNTSDFYANCFPYRTKLTCDKTLIIKKILNILTSRDLTKNLMSIVAIQQKHFSFKSALHSVKLVFEKDPLAHEAICREALQNLHITDYIQQVLSIAYSFFNIDFLLFVYQNSGEDPKVYEPLIESLRSLDPVELRFQMSLKANNMTEAVKYLLRCKSYDKLYIETFIVKNKVEDVAYKSLPSSSKYLEMVSVLYAKRLSVEKKHAEAALLLQKTSLPQEALEQFIKALDWREVLHLCTSLNYTDCDKKEILCQLSQELVNAHRIDESVLLLERSNEHKRAIQILMEHKAFKKAIILAKLYGATEFLNDTLIPNLKSYIIDLMNKIEEFKATFLTHLNRLQQIRTEKKAKLDDSNLGIYDVDDDLFSESGSTVYSLTSHGSSQTRRSTLSSRNKRKEAKKKITIRQGGYYEDIALIRVLHILYSNVFALGSEVREVCLILDHDCEDLVQLIHRNLNHLQDIMKANIDVIWPDVFLNVPQMPDNAALAIVQNKEHLDPKYCIPPCDEVLNLNWKLDIYS